MMTVMTVIRARASYLQKALFGLLGLLGLAVIIVIVAGLSYRNPGDAFVPAGWERNEAHYLTMRDGVRIAADVWYPADLQADQQVPVIMLATRYWRAIEAGFLGKALIRLKLIEAFNEDSDIYQLNQAGYAVVTVDARGTGASFGQRPIKWSPDEIEDLGEVVEWIVQQPWSNGKVGTFGISYPGNLAELTAVSNHSALKAIAPLYGDFDPYAHLFYPGGVFNDTYTKAWSKSNSSQDANDICQTVEATRILCFFVRLAAKGVKPVDSEEGAPLLSEAIAEHDNWNMYETLNASPYRDDVLAIDLSYADISPYGMGDEIEHSAVPIYVEVSWMDAGTVDGALARYLSFKNPQQLTIGAWQHGGSANRDPFFFTENTENNEEGDSEAYDGLMKARIAFFDRYLKDEATSTESKITYYTLAEGVWKESATWPPEEAKNQRWYFEADGRLTTTPPTVTTARDNYQVDFSATTGEATRWHNNLGGGLFYDDRSTEDQKLLTYTSEPLEQDMEVTGNPVIALHIATSVADPAFHVYLEDVAPDGRVTYITEGNFRAIHRKLSDEEPPYVALGPFHTFKRQDAQPMVPGQVSEIRFHLFGTSVLFKAGHRIRIAIAGHEASHFAEYAQDERPVFTIERNSVQASYIDLPTIEKP